MIIDKSVNNFIDESLCLFTIMLFDFIVSRKMICIYDTQRKRKITFEIKCIGIAIFIYRTKQIFV